MATETVEQVQQIPIREMHEFKGHPFQVRDDEDMQKTVESIQTCGITTPILVRPDPNGGYEIISGHRRHHAAELIGLEKIPCIVREMDDITAVITMVDSNLHREHFLPSELAFAYGMKLDAIKKQGRRTDLMSGHGDQEPDRTSARDKVGEATGDSGHTVQRYVRLRELIPEVLQLVDDKIIAFGPAVELSYLKQDEQKELLDAMDYAQATHSLSQAQRLKKLSQEGGCTPEAMRKIMDEIKKDDMGVIKFKVSELQKYFPDYATPADMSELIIRLLKQHRRRQLAQSR